MEFIYGKLNKDLELVEYQGLSTPTARVEIDNNEHTIKVNVLNSPNQLSTNTLVHTKQYLSDGQINQVYSNLKLLDYLNKNTILVDKESQNVTGDFRVDGKLTTSNQYITINNSDKVIEDNAGLKILNWNKNKNAFIYVNKNGELKYSNDVLDSSILLGSNLSYNKFTYFDGQTLSTRSITVNDIDLSNYKPNSSQDLVTKTYADTIVKSKSNYRVFETMEDLSNSPIYEDGSRIFIIEEAIV